MKTFVALFFLLFAVSCGSTSSVSTMGIMTPSPITFNASPEVHPASLPTINVLATGQSNMAYGTEDFGIHSEFGRRAKLYNPGRPVNVAKIAIGGQGVDQWLDGGVMAQQLDNRYKGPPANVLIVHQGEADRNMRGDVWINRWGMAIQRMRNKGQLSGDAKIVFGELAQGGPASTMNNHINNLQRYGAMIARSDGLNTSDGVHFTPAYRNIMGRRYYNLIKDSGGM